MSGIYEDGDRRDACPTFSLSLVTGLRAERYDPAGLGCYEKRFLNEQPTALDIQDAVIQISLTMKTATVRDLRNRFPRVAAWISEGEPVEITRAGKLFARLVPATPEKPRKLVKPDIMAQLKETWGDRVFSAKEVAEMRAAELEGEEG